MKKNHFALLVSMSVMIFILSTASCKVIASEASIITALRALRESYSQSSLLITNGSAVLNDVTVTLEKAAGVKKSDPERYEYSFRGTIENNSEEGIMQVTYVLSLYDSDGNQYHSYTVVYDGESEAIPPHTKIEFSHDNLRWGPQSVPASVSVDIKAVKTETELPPAHIPQTGEFLYKALGNEKLADIKSNPPTELSFHVDQGGYGRTATFRKGESLDRAVELFCDIQIGDETGEWVTDNYNWICLTWEDSSVVYISLNLRNLEYFVHSVPHMYHLEHLNEFWSYAAGFLKED